MNAQWRKVDEADTTLSMKKGLIVSVVSVAIAASAVVFAADPDTVVTLKNGDVSRGVLVEKVTGDHVTIQLATGETRTYPWAEVESVKGAAAPPPAPAPPAPKRETGALVHLESDDDDAAISKLVGRGEGAFSAGTTYGSITLEVVDNVCFAPCGKRIPGGRYRMTGERLIDSEDFDLPDSGEVTVHAHMAGRGRRVGWMMGLFGGIPLLTGGLLMLILASNMDPPKSASTLGYTEPDVRPTFYGIGGVMVGLGVLGTALGIYFVTTAHSDVSVTQGNSPEALLSRGGTVVF